MKRWPEVELGSRCEVFSGYPFKSAQFTEDPDDVALVKGENVGQGEILWEISKRWPREDAEDLCRYRLEPDDVVLAMDRPWVPAGLKFAQIRASDPEALLVQRVARLRAFDGLDQNFLYCVIGSPEFVAYIKNIGRGVGVPHISGKQIGEYLLRLPPPQVQRSIADILSAYDDLIENNRRRMALLEEAARQLYREWFVRLRFPGHEHTRITNGVPEGWDDCRVRDFGQVVTGKTPSTKEAGNYGGDIPFIKTPDMHGNVFVVETEASLTDTGANTQPGKFIPPNTLLVSSIGTVGIVSMTSARAQFNQQINAVVPFEGTYGCYLFFALRDLKEAMEAIGGGATMSNVNKTKFESLKVVKPAVSLLHEFQEFCAPLFQQIQGLSVQNLRLRSARDLLLPRLMSGDIVV
ncbi:MAG: restriction endonuclease subunit S [bacterium]